MRKLRLKNKLSQKQKEKIANILAISVLLIFIASISAHFINDAKKIKMHMEECRSLCHPQEVIENLSFEHCVCKKTLSVEDTI